MDSETNSSTTTEEGPPSKKAKHLPDKDPTKRDLASLPQEVLLNIFKYLDSKSINNCAMLCSTLNNISKNSSLYKKVTLKYNMNLDFLKSLVSKVSRPIELYIEYKFYDQQSETENFEDFNKYVGILLRKCGEHLLSLQIESCRNEEVLENISECTNLKKLILCRCKSSFKSLLSIRSLNYLLLVSCHFPPKIVGEFVKNNEDLNYLNLFDNVNVNVNEICENLSKYNPNMTEIQLSERKKLKARSVKALARLTNLRRLELISGSGFDCDPEDSLEQLAAGCPFLERLVIYGWKELNDDNLIPALHMFTQLKELDLRGTNITIKSCREAALTLPMLRLMDVIKCQRVKKAQLAQLRKDFPEIDIPLET